MEKKSLAFSHYRRASLHLSFVRIQGHLSPSEATLLAENHPQDFGQVVRELGRPAAKQLLPIQDKSDFLALNKNMCVDTIQIVF